MYSSRLWQPIKGPPPLLAADSEVKDHVERAPSTFEQAFAAQVAAHSVEPKDEPSGEPSGEQSRPRAAITKVRPLMVWKYNDDTDLCAICRGKLIFPCVDCSKPLAVPCIVQWGACSHVYHAHCIDKWIGQRAACPQCQREWIALTSDDPVKPEDQGSGPSG